MLNQACLTSSKLFCVYVKNVPYRERIKAMFYHAYNSYLDNAYPYDELRPLTCDGQDTWGRSEKSFTMPSFQLCAFWRMSFEIYIFVSFQLFPDTYRCFGYLAGMMPLRLFISTFNFGYVCIVWKQFVWKLFFCLSRYWGITQSFSVWQIFFKTLLTLILM